MADVKNAIISFIGKIELSKENIKKVLVKITNSFGEKQTYVVYQNTKTAFDEIKKFENNYYKVGDKIDFYYNSSTGNYFPNIWRIVNHRTKEN